MEALKIQEALGISGSPPSRGGAAKARAGPTAQNPATEIQAGAILQMYNTDLQLGPFKTIFFKPLSSFLSSPFCPRNAAEAQSVGAHKNSTLTHFLGWLLSFWRLIFEGK